MLQKTIKNRLLIPWYILVFFLVFLGLLRFKFILGLNEDLEHTSLQKQVMIHSYKLKNLHDSLIVEVKTSNNYIELEKLIDIKSDEIDIIYTELIGFLNKLDNNNNHTNHWTFHPYNNYRLLSNDIISLLKILIRFKQNNELEKVVILENLLTNKNRLINAMLKDIIITNEKHENDTFSGTTKEIFNGFIHQSGSILFVVIGAILLTIYQFRTISIPASRLLKQLDIVKNGGRGDFKAISSIKEISSIASAIDNMVQSLLDSKEIIIHQNKDLSLKLAELRMVKKNLREAQKRANLGSWSWDPFKGFSFPPLTQKLFNLKKSHMNSFEILKWIPDSSRLYLIKKIFRQIRENNRISIDFKYPPNIWITISGKVYYDHNRIICIRGTMQNITDRVLRNQERDELAVAIKQSSNSILITDLDANILFVNDALLKMSGYSKEEVIGQNPAMFSSGKTQENTYKGMWDTIKKGNTWSGLFYNQTKSGEQYTEFCKITPLKSINGTIYKYIGVKEKISQGDLNKEDFEYYLKQMENLVEERTKELIIALDKAEESSKAKEKFIANMSHEIRTPMNAILGMINLINNTELSKEQKDYIDQINIAGNLLLSIINDILDFSKAEANMMTLEQQELEVSKLLSDINKMMQNQAQKKSLYLKIFNKTEVSGIYVDIQRLTQALVNLISNAIKYTENGGVTLTVETTKEDNETVTLLFSIEDTGIGITDDFKDKLFEPFKQGTSSYEQKQGGSGLGLVITRKIVELMGGEIGFHNNKTRGCCFWFSLTCPKCFIEQSHISEEKEPVEAELLDKLGHLNIIIADDDEINRLVLSGLFDNKDVTIYEAENGQIVLDLYEQDFTYDIILMDMKMPVMNGLEATRKIRATDPLIPIIALTANAYDTDKRNCMLAGMNEFIAKPYAPEKIYSSMYKYISEYHREMEHIDFTQVSSVFGSNLQNFKKISAMFFKNYHNFEITDMNREFVHKMKGSSGNLGFYKIMNQCKLSLDDIESIKLKRDIIESLRVTEHIVKRLFNRLDSFNRHNQSPMNQLIDNLNNNDSESLDCFNMNYDAIRKIMDIEDFIELKNSINSFDLVKSLNICQKYNT